MEVRCLEWFSGIGGLHYGLLEAQKRISESSTINSQGEKLEVSVVAAFDINELANRTYEHNFQKAPITKNIEHFTLAYVEKFRANVWLMSPPCQPYTQGGKQRDHLDSRAAGLLHLIKLLDNMHDPPKFLFLENVPGFETSECHKLLTNVLKRKDYQIEEYMLMPTDPAVGIPNRRRRYYLSAKLSTTEESAFIEDHIITSFAEIGVSNAIETKTLLDFYKTANDSVEEYLVPLDFIRSAKDFRFDIVDPVKDVSCATFTKAYGSKYVIGTGSFIHTRNKDIEKYQPDDQSILPSLGLRFFAPMEIAELHAFPVPANAEDKDSSVVSFQFPDKLTLIQKWRLLGNSLNVRVVALLLIRLLYTK